MIMAFWIGLYPKPFFQILSTPVNNLVATVRPDYPGLTKPVLAAQPREPRSPKRQRRFRESPEEPSPTLPKPLDRQATDSKSRRRARNAQAGAWCNGTGDSCTCRLRPLRRQVRMKS